MVPMVVNLQPPLTRLLRERQLVSALQRALSQQTPVFSLLARELPYDRRASIVAFIPLVIREFEDTPLTFGFPRVRKRYVLGEEK
jgi:hypothetical protein